jgi:hypothetical protein
MDQLIETPPSEQFSSEARLLLREFSHRINNEFASAIGVISIAATRSTNNEAKATLVAVQDQLENYAHVHHALQMPEHRSCIDAAAYLRQLCRAISRSKLDSKGIELLLVGRTFRIDSERCWRRGAGRRVVGSACTYRATCRRPRRLVASTSRMAGTTRSNRKTSDFRSRHHQTRVVARGGLVLHAPKGVGPLSP